MATTTPSISVSVYKGPPSIDGVSLIKNAQHTTFTEGSGSTSSSIVVLSSNVLFPGLGRPTHVLSTGEQSVLLPISMSITTEMFPSDDYYSYVTMSFLTSGVLEADVITTYEGGEPPPPDFKAVYTYSSEYPIKPLDNWSLSEALLLTGDRIYADGTPVIETSGAVTSDVSFDWTPSQIEKTKVSYSTLPIMGCWPFPSLVTSSLNVAKRLLPTLDQYSYTNLWNNSPFRYGGYNAAFVRAGADPWPIFVQEAQAYEPITIVETNTAYMFGDIQSETGSAPGSPITMSFNSNSFAYGWKNFNSQSHISCRVNSVYDGSPFIQTFVVKLDSYPSTGVTSTLCSYGTSSGDYGWYIGVNSSGNVSFKSRSSNTIFTGSSLTIVPTGTHQIISVGYVTGASGSTSFTPFIKVGTNAAVSRSYTGAGVLKEPTEYVLDVYSPILLRLGSSWNNTGSECQWLGSIYEMKISNGGNAAGSDNCGYVSASWVDALHEKIISGTQKKSYGSGYIRYWSLQRGFHYDATYDSGTGWIALSSTDSVASPSIIWDVSGNMHNVLEVSRTLSASRIRIEPGANDIIWPSATFFYSRPSTFALTGESSRGDGGFSGTTQELSFDVLRVTGYKTGSDIVPYIQNSDIVSVSSDTPFYLKGGGFAAVSSVEIWGFDGVHYTTEIYTKVNGVAQQNVDVFNVIDDQTIEITFPVTASAWASGSHVPGDLVYVTFTSAPAGTYYYTCAVANTNIKPVRSSAEGPGYLYWYKAMDRGISSHPDSFFVVGRLPSYANATITL
jgi:hypothetical protein